MSLRWLGVLVAGAMVAGCAPPDDPVLGEQPSGDAVDSIQGGYADPTDTAVVGVVDVNNGGICSGSLIAPNLVLTARHCVSRTLNTAPNGGIICSQTTSGSPTNATNLYVTTDEEMDYQGNWYQGREVVGLPSDNKFCGQDQALIILQENIPAEAAVPLVPRVDSALVEDELYYAVGYGQTSDSPNAPSGSRRRRDNLAVYCAEEGCSEFDSYMTSTEWIGDTGICSGDSGGPAIDLQNRVVGVTSRGGQNCSSPIYGSTHSWGQWLKDTAIYAAQLGAYDPAPWASGWPTDPAYSLPIGDACDTTTCQICINNLCTRPCLDDVAPCPESYQCEAFEDGTQFCTPTPEPADEDGGGSKKKKKADSAEEQAESGGCSAGGREDPTNPVPWRTGALALAVLALRRRRR